MRKADELSITTAPAALAAGTNSRLRVAPAEKKGDVDALERPGGQLLDLVGLAFELEGLAGGALRGQQLQAGDGEVAAFEERAGFRRRRRRSRRPRRCSGTSCSLAFGWQKRWPPFYPAL
jgi:hypothetical protein